MNCILIFFIICLTKSIYLPNKRVQENKNISELEIIYSDDSGASFLSFYIGNPLLKSPFRISLQIPYNYVPFNAHDTQIEFKLLNINKTILINNKPIKGVSAQLLTCISPNGYCVEDLHYYIVNSTIENRIYETLSFALLPEENEFSFIHQLASKGIIAKKQISFEPISIKIGRIIYGELPKMYINNKHVYLCKSYNNYWGCPLDRVTIGNDTYIYENKEKSLFDTLDKFWYVPKNFFNFITKTVFDKYIKKKACWLKEDKTGSIQFYQCQCSELRDFPYIHFFFVGHAFTMTTYLLFDYDGQYCESLIHYSIGDNKWIFGTRFVHSFLTNFDYDKKMITFYTSSKLRKYEEKMKFQITMKNIIIVNNIILLLQLSFSIFIKIFKENNVNNIYL